MRAIVYTARDTLLGRKVAWKILPGWLNINRKHQIALSLPGSSRFIHAFLIVRVSGMPVVNSPTV